MNASNVAHERTRPVALRTNRSRVLVAALVAPPPIPNVAIAAPLCPRGRRPFPHLLPARPRPGVCYTPLLRPPDGPTDQHVAGSACGNRSPISYELIAGCWARLALMSVLTRGERVIDDLAAVEVNQGAQEGALLIRAPRVDAQRPSDSAFAPPLVNVAEEGQRRLVPHCFSTCPAYLGRICSSSSGASSNPQPWAGQCKLKMQPSIADTSAAIASILRPRSSSSSSRWVFQGVRLAHPVLIMQRWASRLTTRPSARETLRASRSTSSTAKTSSLP